MNNSCFLQLLCVLDPAYIPVGADRAARGPRIKPGHARPPGTPRQHLRGGYIEFKLTSSRWIRVRLWIFARLWSQSAGISAYIEQTHADKLG